MNIAIIGAGWAGLASASECLARGFRVTLFDAAHTPGGRARSVEDPVLGELDNGQHLLIGAYSKTLELLARDTGQSTLEANLLRQRLWLKSADNRFELRARHNQPSALDQALMLLRARGLGVRDKWLIARFLRRLASGLANSQSIPDPTGKLTVQQWLQEQGQSANSCRWLWYPLCLATMNTSPADACARLFANVIRDSLLSSVSGATDLLIPRTTLGQLWPSAVANRTHTRWGHVVRQLSPSQNGIAVDGQHFDGCILATPPASTHRLLVPLPETSVVCDQLEKFEYRAIATCYVSIEHHEQLPAPLLMFDHEQPNAGAAAHWVFDRTQIMSSQPTAELAFVVSNAGDLSGQSDMEVAQGMVRQLYEALRRPSLLKILGARCFVEKRATFAAVSGLKRPTNRTPIKHLALAGDWTDTGYPSVIEGAVSSGIAAVNALLR